MVSHSAKERFYQKLLHIETPGEYSPEAIKNPPEEITTMLGDTIEQAEKSGLYELCQKYSDIALNALKIADPKTCAVSASFQYEDIETAKRETKAFIERHGLTDYSGLLAVIKVMHRYAKYPDDSRTTGGLVHPKNYDYKPGFAGVLYNFREIPQNMWDSIENEVLEYISRT